MYPREAYLNIPFERDEIIMCYFYGYSGLIFGLLNEFTFRQLKKDGYEIEKVSNLIDEVVTRLALQHLKGLQEFNYCYLIIF